jgi:hypothetical protein
MKKDRWWITWHSCGRCESIWSKFYRQGVDQYMTLLWNEGRSCSCETGAYVMDYPVPDGCILVFDERPV